MATTGGGSPACSSERLNCSGDTGAMWDPTQSIRDPKEAARPQGMHDTRHPPPLAERHDTCAAIPVTASHRFAAPGTTPQSTSIEAGRVIFYAR